MELRFRTVAALDFDTEVLVPGNGVLVVAWNATKALSVICWKVLELSLWLSLSLSLFLFFVVLVGVIVLVEHLSGGPSWWRFHHGW